jgi:hypothetical protein
MAVAKKRALTPVLLGSGILAGSENLKGTPP